MPTCRRIFFIHEYTRTCIQIYNSFAHSMVAILTTGPLWITCQSIHCVDVWYQLIDIVQEQSCNLDQYTCNVCGSKFAENGRF